MGPLDTHPKDYGTVRVVTELIPLRQPPRALGSFLLCELLVPGGGKGCSDPYQPHPGIS